MSAIYIIDTKGRVLINFDYRGEIDMSIPDKFMSHIQQNEKMVSFPVFRVDEWCFAYIMRSSLYFVAATLTNSNVALLLSFLSSLANLFKFYLEKLTAEDIIDNFSLVYELLDEVMDFGYPQLTDPKALSEYIQKNKPQDLSKQPSSVPIDATGIVSWRKGNPHYSVNEVFVDVVEKVNMLVAKNGSVINNEIIGEINLATYLSGRPEIVVGLNETFLFDVTNKQQQNQIDVSRNVFELEDIKFHPCVKMSQYEKDKTIAFIPPDGEFNLMTYRLSTALKPIIHIDSTIEKYSRSRIEMLIRARSQYRSQSVAQNVQIRIPVPPDVDTPKAQCSAGRMRYSPNENALIWTIKQFPGRKQFTLRAHFGLPSVESEEEESKRPIVINFEIPFFTVSGVKIQYLKVFEKSGYQAVTWVSYLSKDGTYEFRT